MHNRWVSQISIIQKDVWLQKWSRTETWPRKGNMSFSELKQCWIWLLRLHKWAHMLIVLVSTSLSGYAHSYVWIWLERRELFLKVCPEITVYTSVRCQDCNHVLLICFVMFLANFQIVVSKCEFHPSSQSEFSSWFYTLAISHILRVLSETLYCQV